MHGVGSFIEPCHDSAIYGYIDIEAQCVTYNIRSWMGVNACAW